MDYLPTSEIAKKWNISNRRVQILASAGRIEGAQKVGGVWLIPITSTKPTVKLSEKNDYYNKTVSNRAKLKVLLRNASASLAPNNSNNEIRRIIIGTLNSNILSMLMGTLDSDSVYKIANESYIFMGGRSNIQIDAYESLFNQFNSFVQESNGDVLNILSWTYQYLNPILSANNKYTNTQFFTEQYMIDYLLSKLGESYRGGAVFDPCCGGGNMLTAVVEKIFFSQKKRNYKSLLRILKNVYGYDIDPLLTKVAILNIKAKGIELLKKNGEEATFEIWQSLKPRIYSSDRDNEGSLAFDKVITNSFTGEKSRLMRFQHKCEIVITNPPFATVKGMEKDLNMFLKKNYLESNSDLSASFILKCGEFINRDGKALMVVQNAWMFLDSFADFRHRVLQNFSFEEIVDLGSGAFLDLTGEKSNVALIKFTKLNCDSEIRYKSLKNGPLKEKINGLLKNTLEVHYLNQSDVLKNEKARFDILNIGSIRDFYYSGERISDFMTPMQGTSTGNNKELVGYFWNHFGESEWRLVSKGGGYSRWQGLNRYVVRWGESGEFIKNQKGSAIRNSRFFDQTELVFSDTGTSGLNVRVLLSNQLFIASGPGIRINKGNKYALLALLNSRLSSYYLRILSPKLTIAAGYIGKIPVNSEIANSDYLVAQAQICINSKKLILMNRPNNFEFSFEIMDSLEGSLETIITNLIMSEIKLELQKIEAEANIENYIIGKSGISISDIEYIWNEIGTPVSNLNSKKIPVIREIEKVWVDSTDFSVYLNKNRNEKHHIGSDGILEYMSQKFQTKPSDLVKVIEEHVLELTHVRKKFQNLWGTALQRV